VKRARDILFVGVVTGGLAALLVSLPPVTPTRPAPPSSDPDPDSQATVDQVDAAFRSQWQFAGIEPAAPAPELLQARRIALGLMGTVPSLEEIRQLEALPPDQRLPWYLDHVLADRRCHDYLAERLARAYVGTEEGPFLYYRRRRLVAWLSDRLAANESYDRVASQLIASDGLWTDSPATNFVSVTVRTDPDVLADEDRLAGRLARAANGLGFVSAPVADPARLARRVSRAFLGVRLDCAQCHDHPFAGWKRADFDGLAAFFGQTNVGFAGVRDGAGEYFPERRGKKSTQAVEPRVPFAPELLPADGSRRERLAGWATHPDNPYFARAMVNRVWALLVGRPLVAPVDDLPPVGPPALDVLAGDFAAHRFDLRRLIRLIACTEVFRLDSATDHETGPEAEPAWAVFPLTRLRPEQLAGGVSQAASVATLDARTHLLFRISRQRQEDNFVRRYGDAGEDEFDDRGGTIPQRLLMMNGQLVRDRTGSSLRNTSTRIAWLAADDPRAVEAAYLAVLSRRPTPQEAAHFERALREPAMTRAQHLEDLYWALINSTEFAWNH
jgi:hypothetical protein